MNSVLGQWTRFVTAGIVNTAIGLAVIFTTMSFAGVGAASANAIGYGIGFVASFALNRSWTFRSKEAPSRQFPRFLLVAAGSYLLNLLAVLMAIDNFSTDPYLAQAMGLAVYTFCFFLGCRWFVFRHRQAA